MLRCDFIFKNVHLFPYPNVGSFSQIFHWSLRRGTLPPLFGIRCRKSGESTRFDVKVYGNTVNMHWKLKCLHRALLNWVVFIVLIALNVHQWGYSFNDDIFVLTLSIGCYGMSKIGPLLECVPSDSLLNWLWVWFVLQKLSDSCRQIILKSHEF